MNLVTNQCCGELNFHLPCGRKRKRSDSSDVLDAVESSSDNSNTSGNNTKKKDKNESIASRLRRKHDTGIIMNNIRTVPQGQPFETILNKHVVLVAMFSNKQEVLSVQGSGASLFFTVKGFTKPLDLQRSLKSATQEIVMAMFVLLTGYEPVLCDVYCYEKKSMYTFCLQRIVTQHIPMGYILTIEKMHPRTVPLNILTPTMTIPWFHYNHNADLDIVNQQLWITIHHMSVNLAPTYDTTPMLTGDLWQWLHSIGRLMGCKHCGDHWCTIFETIFASRKAQLFSSQNRVIIFLYDLHNIWNKMLKKPKFTWSAFQLKYNCYDVDYTPMLTCLLQDDGIQLFFPVDIPVYTSNQQFTDIQKRKRAHSAPLPLVSDLEIALCVECTPIIDSQLVKLPILPIDGIVAVGPILPYATTDF